MSVMLGSSPDLDLFHPAQDVEHFLEDFVQVVGELQTHAAGTQQLKQVVPQAQNIILPENEQTLSLQEFQEQAKPRRILLFFFVLHHSVHFSTRISNLFFVLNYKTEQQVPLFSYTEYEKIWGLC